MKKKKKKAVQGYIALIVEDIKGKINFCFNEAFFQSSLNREKRGVLRVLTREQLR